MLRIISSWVDIDPAQLAEDQELQEYCVYFANQGRRPWPWLFMRPQNMGTAPGARRASGVSDGVDIQQGPGWEKQEGAVAAAAAASQGVRAGLSMEEAAAAAGTLAAPTGAGGGQSAGAGWRGPPAVAAPENSSKKGVHFESEMPGGSASGGAHGGDRDPVYGGTAAEAGSSHSSWGASQGASASAGQPMAADAYGSSHGLSPTSHQSAAYSSGLFKPWSLEHGFKSSTSSGSSGEGVSSSTWLEMQLRRGQEQQQGDVNMQAASAPAPGVGGGSGGVDGGMLQTGHAYPRSGRNRRASDLTTLVEVSENSTLFHSSARHRNQLNGDLGLHMQEGVSKWGESGAGFARGPGHALGEGIEAWASYDGMARSWGQLGCHTGYQQPQPWDQRQHQQQQRPWGQRQQHQQQQHQQPWDQRQHQQQQQQPWDQRQQHQQQPWDQRQQQHQQQQPRDQRQQQQQPWNQRQVQEQKWHFQTSIGDLQATTGGAQAVAEGIEIQPLAPSAACGIGGLHRLSEEQSSHSPHQARAPQPWRLQQQQQQHQGESLHVLSMANIQREVKLNDATAASGVDLNTSAPLGQSERTRRSSFQLKDVFRRSRRNSRNGPPAGRSSSLTGYSSNSAELVAQLRLQLSQGNTSFVSGSSFSFGSRDSVSFSQNNRTHGLANGYSSSQVQQEQGLHYGEVGRNGRRAGQGGGGGGGGKNRRNSWHSLMGGAKDRRNSWHSLGGGLNPAAAAEAAARAGGSARGGNQFYRRSIGPCSMREREVASCSSSRRPSRGQYGEGMLDGSSHSRVPGLDGAPEGNNQLRTSGSSKSLLKSSSNIDVMSELEQQVMLEGGLHSSSSRRRRSLLYNQGDGPGAPAEFDQGLRIALPTSLVVAAAEAVGAGVGYSNQSLQFASTHLVPSSHPASSMSSPMNSAGGLQRLMMVGGEDYSGDLFPNEEVQQRQQHVLEGLPRGSRRSIDVGSTTGTGNLASLGTLLRHASVTMPGSSGSRRHSLSLEGVLSAGPGRGQAAPTWQQVSQSGAAAGSDGSLHGRRHSLSISDGRRGLGNSAPLRGLSRQSFEGRGAKQAGPVGPLGSLLRQVSLGAPSLAGTLGSSSAPLGTSAVGPGGSSGRLYKVGSGGFDAAGGAGVGLGASSTGGSIPMGTLLLRGSSGGWEGSAGGSSSRLDAAVLAGGGGSGLVTAGTPTAASLRYGRLLKQGSLGDLAGEAASACQCSGAFPVLPWRATSAAGAAPAAESHSAPAPFWHGSASAVAAAAAVTAAAAFDGDDSGPLAVRRAPSSSAVSLTAQGLAAAGLGAALADHSGPLAAALWQGAAAVPGVITGEHSGPLAVVLGAGPKAAEVCPEMPSVAPLPDQEMLQSLRMTGASSRGPQSAHETEKSTTGFEGPSIGQTCSELMAGSWLWARQLLVHDLGTFK